MRTGSVVVAAAMVVALTSCQHDADAMPRQPPSGDTAGVPVESWQATAGTTAATGTQQARGCPRRILAHLSLAQRVGQLFVSGVSSTSPSSTELNSIRRLHLGGVILMGHNDAGVAATKQVSRRLQAQATPASTDHVRLWVSVDQEGGYVQVLNGPGFDVMPTALEQGALPRPALRARAHRWGRQLHRAGVNLDLAPVLDTVPASLGRANKPIGFYYREYGHTPAVVAAKGSVVSNQLERVHVQTTAKHFPGLGRVKHNTDTNPHVVDKVTTRHDGYLRPFRAAIADGVPVVMVSLAHYARIDRARVAAFSPVVMRGMLRHDLGFSGVIMSDSMTASAVQAVAVARRGVRFLRAGGTVVLSVTPSTVAPMAGAVLNLARSDAGFRATVSDDALTVLRAKHRNGLLPC